MDIGESGGEGWQEWMEEKLGFFVMYLREKNLFFIKHVKK